jgi:hypothetical protein
MKRFALVMLMPVVLAGCGGNKRMVADNGDDVMLQLRQMAALMDQSKVSKRSYDQSQQQVHQHAQQQALFQHQEQNRIFQEQVHLNNQMFQQQVQMNNMNNMIHQQHHMPGF